MGDIIFTGNGANGRIKAPPSKSYTHRAILMAALSGGYCRISDPLDCADTRSTASFTEDIGAEISREDGDIIVVGGSLHPPNKVVDVDNSGTTLRMATAILACMGGSTEITGDLSILERPMQPLLTSLENSGAICSSENGKPPVRVGGPITADEIVVDGRLSSQFVSAPLLAAPMLKKDITVLMSERPVSRPYIDMTVDMMKRFGADVAKSNGPYGWYYKVGSKGYSPADVSIPSDFSSAAVPLIAGAMSGRVEVMAGNAGWDMPNSPLISALQATGSKVFKTRNSVSCVFSGQRKAADIDVGDMPDMFPSLAVLLSVCRGRSRLYGGPQLRFKETDRISAVVSMINALGGSAKATPDGCAIEGRKTLTGGEVEVHGDHRMMMAAALASLVTDEPVKAYGDPRWEISYPDFPKDMKSIGVTIEKI